MNQTVPIAKLRLKHSTAAFLAVRYNCRWEAGRCRCQFWKGSSTCLSGVWTGGLDRCQWEWRPDAANLSAHRMFLASFVVVVRLLWLRRCVSVLELQCNRSSQRPTASLAKRNGRCILGAPGRELGPVRLARLVMEGDRPAVFPLIGRHY